MKRIAYSLMMLVVATFIFTSCEDVPSPFGTVTPPNTSTDSDETTEIKGTGTVSDPFNIAAIIAQCNKLASGEVSEQAYYFKGKVSAIAVDKSGNAQNFNYGTYGNASFYISDDGTTTNQFYCYRVLYLGNKKWTEGAGESLKVGDDVIVCAKLTNYNGTLETQQNEGYLYSLNGKTEGGGGGDTPSGDAKGTGTQADPFNIAAAIIKCQEIGTTPSTEKYYIKGIVVKGGTATGGYGNISFDMGDTKDATATFKAFQVAGSDGEKLADGYTVNAGDEVVVYGPIYNYQGNTPETSGKSAAQIVTINGKKTSEGGGGTPSGEAKAVTIAEFNAAAESTDVWYQLTGTIKSLKEGDQYGNFDLEDATGSVYVYGLLSEKGGEKKKFQELVAAQGLQAGTKITIIGNRGSYNGQIQVANAYFVKVEGGGDTPGGGGDTPSTLTNGGFETWADGIPTGWKSASSASSATLAQSTDAHTGSYSCNVKGDASANKRLASQEITLAAGTYNFSFWVKPTTSNAAQVRPGYVPIGADGKAGSYAYGDYATLTAGWQQVSYDFTLDAETTVCLVVMNPKKSNYSSGEDVLIDDATLTKK